MTNLSIHPSTQLLIDAYMRAPAHAVLLSGPTGIGTYAIAQFIAKQLKARSDDIHLIAPDEKGTITIEKVRSLNAITRARYDSPRIIIIDDAENMSPPAQNALLKLLEEPPNQTYFILTSHQPQLLLQTVRSRTQHIDCRPVNEEASRQLLIDHGQASELQAQLLFIAQGLPAELIRLTDDPSYFESQAKLVTEARSLLQTDTYGRLVLIKNYTDRTQASALVSMLGRLVHFMLMRQARADLAEVLDAVETVYGQLQANGNVRIQLTYLATRLP